MKVGRPTTALVASRKAVQRARASGHVSRRQSIPEYLESPEIDAVIQFAPHPEARILMMLQWRAGLRIAEALDIQVADIHLGAGPIELGAVANAADIYIDVAPNSTDVPHLRVRFGKGSRSRLVPLHPELATQLANFMLYNRQKTGHLVKAHTSTAWRWYKLAAKAAVEANVLTPGRKVATHTLRHSAARHWLANGVPINQVSLWLGHASLQTTLIYLQLLPDTGKWMERVP